MDQQYHNQGHALAIKSLEQNGHPIDDNKSMMSMSYLLPSNVQMDCTDWMQANTLPYNNNIYGTLDTGIRATISESASDGDLASRGL